ncbi:DNA-processing protein DprA [Pontibacillus salicampi]|uniref:DNA-processing protein DprA n=1 Tax=Pontibacillus salicampi TaxID=1449801 RepID=A0ABV6LNZ3_9BACI
METISMRLSHVARAVNGNRKILRYLLSVDPSLEHTFHYSVEDWKTLLRLSSSKAQTLFQFLHNSNQQLETRQYAHQNIILTSFDEAFPATLRNIPDPPLVLYVMGDVSLLNSLSLSVVGTRKPTLSAYSKMEYILKPVIQKQCVIVSGLAKGIDTFAHQIALQHSGSTIAVLAFGFKHCYPLENRVLMKELASDHLLISEYPPFQRPQKWYFPERNRLISGLGYGTFVIEAMERSGSLITADQALEQGKEVYALPGDIQSSASKGCNNLIQQGAKLVQHPQDIMEDIEHEAQMMGGL